MDNAIEMLRLRMEAAAAALDFEEAKRLRDRINLIRGGASVDEATQMDTDGLQRQRPGAMGIGTSRSDVVRPAGWTQPKKPDLGAKRSRRRPT